MSSSCRLELELLGSSAQCDSQSGCCLAAASVADWPKATYRLDICCRLRDGGCFWVRRMEAREGV